MRIADSHSDYLAFHVLNNWGGHVSDQSSILRMQQGGIVLQNLAVWSPVDVPDGLSCSLSQIASLYRILKETPNAYLCTCPEHLAKSGIGFVLSIESGESIGCKTDRITQFYAYGVRMMSLTWNFENAFASGCYAEGGIKPAGHKALRIMNRLTMSLDVSHLNETGFWEALNDYDMAPCASHSCAYDLCPNPRNLRNQQAEAIIKRHGYIGVNFFPEFLTGEEAKADDVVNHIEYFLDHGGEDSVGFGSDFCGMSSAPGDLATAADFQVIPEILAKRGYSETLADKICYGNFARYILQFLKHDTDECI